MLNFLNLINDGRINWEAISSLATFTAVLVALMPIFSEQRKQRILAKNLRIRILTHLIVIETAIESYVDRCAMDTDGIFFLTNESQVESLRALENLLPEMTLLHEDEYKRLVTAIADMKMLQIKFKKMTEKDLDTFRELMRLIRKNLNRG